ncbi:MAG: cation:proton antiporter [Aestuariivirgaceae bacterium]
MDLFYVLLVLLVATRAFGELAERLSQPALVGELIAGVSLGAIVAEYPAVFPDLVALTENQVFQSLTDLGMFFLMVYAGIEMQPHKILRYSGGASVVAIGGMLLPLALGVGLGYQFLPETELKVAQCLFIGTALAVTAVPATVRVLMDLGQLDTAVGQTVISAAVFDDILSLLLLAMLTGMIMFGQPPDIYEVGLLSLKVIAFFALTTGIGFFIFPWGGRFMHMLKAQELEVSAVLVGAFSFAVLAEFLSMHFIVGAFLGGLFFGRRTISDSCYDRVKNSMSAITFGFLAPIFFASIGFHVDFSALTQAPLFVALLVVFAFLGKIIGAGGAARLFGFDARDALNIGVGMSPRGAVELVIAGLALKGGLFNVADGEASIVQHIFSAVVIMAVITTVFSPIILKRTFSHRAVGSKSEPGRDLTSANN